MSKDTGGPAFPSLNAVCTGLDSDGGERWDTEPSGGMTLRQYAAIKLGVIDSGDEWLDKMIFDSERNKLAAKAMHQFIAGAVFPKGYDRSNDLAMVAALAYETADAMLAERRK